MKETHAVKSDARDAQRRKQMGDLNLQIDGISVKQHDLVVNSVQKQAKEQKDEVCLMKSNI